MSTHAHHDEEPGFLRGRGVPAYEYRELLIPRGTSRAEARQLLTEHAEYGRWELARVRLFTGGVRRVELRRRILRVQRSG